MTEWRLKWYSSAVLSTLAAVFVVCLFSGDNGQTVSGRLGGDFPAFYGAGRIVLGGDMNQLYDFARQLEAQQDLGTSLCFAYPPFVALPYALLAAFPYQVAYLINTLLMLYVLYRVMKILFEKFAVPDRYQLPAFTLTLFFYPIFKALFGGQNTLLSLLLVGLVWLHVDKQQEVLAGVFLGLMLFKPQFAIPLMGLMLVSRRWVVAASSFATGLVIYIGCVFMLGSAWLAKWYEFASWFAETDAVVNSTNAISWAGVLANFESLGMGNALSLGVFLSFLNVLLLIFIWSDKRSCLSALMPVTCLSLTLIPMHVMYYDAGLVIIACFSIIKDLKKHGMVFVLTIWLCAYLQLFSPLIGFSPIIILNLLCLAVACSRFFSNRNTQMPSAELVG